MIYTVLWQAVAENQLALLWIDAPDRDAITAAADELDALLRHDPHSQGESRSGSARLILVPPLAALYDVNDQDRIVRVLKIWRPRWPV